MFVFLHSPKKHHFCFRPHLVFLTLTSPLKQKQKASGSLNTFHFFSSHPPQDSHSSHNKTQNTASKMSSRKSAPQFSVVESTFAKPKNNTSTHIALDLAVVFLQHNRVDIGLHLEKSINHFGGQAELKYDSNAVAVAKRFFSTLQVKEVKLHHEDFQHTLNRATYFAREETSRLNEDVALLFTTTSNSVLLVYDYDQGLWAVFDSFTRPLHQKPAVLFGRSGPTLEYLQEAFSKAPRDPKHSRIFVITLGESDEENDEEEEEEEEHHRHHHHAGQREVEVDRSPYPFTHPAERSGRQHPHDHAHHARAVCHHAHYEGRDREDHQDHQRVRPFNSHGAGRPHPRQQAVPARFADRPRPQRAPPGSVAPAPLDAAQLEYLRILQGRLAVLKLASDRRPRPPAPAPDPEPAPAPAPSPSPELVITPAPAPVVLPKSFDCSICLLEYPIDDIFITSECGHSCCRDCVSNHIMHRINTSCVVPCFENDCTQNLTQIDAQIVLNDENMAKYWKAEQRSACQQKDTFPCPKADCPGHAVVEHPDVKFYCFECSSTKCVRCDVSPFHENLTCDQYMDWRRNNDNGDNSFDDYLRETKHARCPNCSVFVSKTEGCNHITCLCGHHFCYLCNTKLDPKNPYAHFKARGGSDCDLFDIPPEMDD